MAKRLVIILESPLGSDGEELLAWLVRRLSIDRTQWVKTYCYPKNRKTLPKKKRERQKRLAPYVDRLVEFIEYNEPCVLIGMGKLSSEVLLGVTMIKKVTGSKRRTQLPFMLMENHREAWIVDSPNAALFDPNLAVNISQIIWAAALEAGLPAEIDYNVRLFDWSKYI